MELMDAIRGRRTVRAFRADPVPGEAMEQILDAGIWAPSHKNEQPWRFVTIGPETRATLLAMLQKKVDELLAAGEVPPPARKNFESLKQDFGGAPELLAVVARHGEDPLHTQENLIATGCAVQNMMLAAWDAGLGCVWLTVGSVPPAKPVLGAGDDETVVALLAMGVPDAVPPALPREAAVTKLQELP